MAYVDPSIIQGYAPIELPDQGNMLLKALQIQSARGQNRLLDLQVGQQEQSADATNRINTGLAAHPEWQSDPTAMRAGLLGLGGTYAAPVLKNFLDTQKTQGEIDTSGTALALKKHNAVDQAVGSLTALGPNVTHQDVFDTVRGLVNGKVLSAQEAQSDLADMPQDPTQLPGWLAKSQRRGLTSEQQIQQSNPTLLPTDQGIAAVRKDGLGGSMVPNVTGAASYPNGMPGVGPGVGAGPQTINQPYVGQQPRGNFAGDPSAIVAQLQSIRDPNDRAAALRAFQNQMAGANPTPDANGVFQGQGAQGPVQLSSMQQGSPTPLLHSGTLGQKREEIVYHNDPMTGQVMQLPKYANGSPQSGPIAVGGQPSGNISASDQAVVDQIGKYQMAPPSGQLLRTPRGAAILGALAEQYPNFDATEFPARQKAARDFTTGVQGNALRSVSVATDHLDQLSQAGEALKNGNMQVVNKVANFFDTQTGGTAPGAFNAIKQIVGDEVLKAVIGGGAGGVSDRTELAAQLKDASTPSQLAEVIRQYKVLMGAQRDALVAQYENATGRTDAATRFNFKKKGSPAPDAGGWSIEKVN